MNDQDRKAFKEWDYRAKHEESWEAACELKNKQIINLEAEKQKLFIKLSKELEAEKSKSNLLKQENEKLKECIRFYAAGNVQFDYEYMAIEGGLVSKIGSYARKVLTKLENK